MTPNEILDLKCLVQTVVNGSEIDSRVVIARYTAAIAVNFTDWIGKTVPWVRHELAYHTLVDNLRCEAGQDHVGMLLRFATLSGALPGREEYQHVSNGVADIRKLFSYPTAAGLYGLALCAVLENTSEVFIPDLARKAEKCGCTDLTYTNVHGEADVKHSQAFLLALAAEQTMGYLNPELLIGAAKKSALALIARIYH